MTEKTYTAHEMFMLTIGLFPAFDGTFNYHHDTDLKDTSGEPVCFKIRRDYSQLPSVLVWEAVKYDGSPAERKIEGRTESGNIVLCCEDIQNACKEELQK